MEDVLEVYHRPYDRLRPVVCLDERPKTLRGTPRGRLPARPGQAARQDYEYERHGSCNVFVCVEPLVGKRQVSVTERRTLLDFADQLRLLSDDLYPEAEKIVLVLDNLNTHTAAALYERFAPAEARRLASRFEWHYTPEHGSWLNMAEIELSVLSRQCLRRRLASIEQVKREVAAWQQRRAQAHTTIRWQFATADARIKLQRLYPQTREHN
jgi:transposase